MARFKYFFNALVNLSNSFVAPSPPRASISFLIASSTPKTPPTSDTIPPNIFVVRAPRKLVTGAVNFKNAKNLS